MSQAPVPPQAPEAEENVLGAMLLSESAILAVSDVVGPDDFYRGSHGLIFRRALELNKRGEPVDAVTLTDYLDACGELESVGGRVRVHELAALVPATANAAHHARIIREHAALRKLIRAGQEIARLGWERPGEIDDLQAQAERIVTEALSASNTSDFVGMGDAADELYSEIAQAVETLTPIFGARTGFNDLDATLTGLYPGQLIVVAARPGVGKSVFCQNVAENLAGRGTPTAFFSLEMSKRELALRSIVRKTRLDLARLRTGRLTEEELGRVRNVMGEIKQRPMFVEDNPSITPTELRARARRLKAKHGLGLLVVDYLQLMVGESSRDKKNDEIAAISRSLKLLAKELEVPVIAVSQLNRNTEYRQDKRPTLADLRDSGAIEQDADVVLFLYREEVYSQVDADRAGDAEVIVAKNRMGEQKTVKLLFLGRRQTFATPALPGTGGTDGPAA